jgi:hypothetical protein
VGRAPRVRKSVPDEILFEAFSAKYQAPSTHEAVLRKWEPSGVSAELLDEAITAYAEALEGTQASIRKRLKTGREKIELGLEYLRKSMPDIDESLKAIERVVNSAAVGKQPNDAAALFASLEIAIPTVPLNPAHSGDPQVIEQSVIAMKNLWNQLTEFHDDLYWSASNFAAPTGGWFGSLAALHLLLVEHVSTLKFPPGNLPLGRKSVGHEYGEPGLVDIEAMRAAGRVLRAGFTPAWSGQTGTKLPTRAERLLYDVVHLVEPKVSLVNARSAVRPTKKRVKPKFD